MTDSQKYASKLAGKNVLVIGGTSGIGFAAAEGAVENGAIVTISSSNPPRIEKALNRLRESYPSRRKCIHSFECDLGDDDTLESNLEQLFKFATSNGERKLDHIIYTAADSIAVIPLSEISLDKIKRAGSIRFCGPLLVGKLATVYMNKSRESSVSLTTGAVFQTPFQNWSIACAYAAGIMGIGRALACELAPIRANTVSPGPVDTELWDPMTEEQKKALFKEFEAKLPTGQVAKASDVAESYLYLMKDANITGTVISTNGGTIMT